MAYIITSEVVADVISDALSDKEAAKNLVESFLQRQFKYHPSQADEYKFTRVGNEYLARSGVVSSWLGVNVQPNRMQQDTLHELFENHYFKDEVDMSERLQFFEATGVSESVLTLHSTCIGLSPTYVSFVGLNRRWGNCEDFRAYLFRYSELVARLGRKEKKEIKDYFEQEGWYRAFRYDTLIEYVF